MRGHRSDCWRRVVLGASLAGLAVVWLWLASGSALADGAPVSPAPLGAQLPAAVPAPTSLTATVENGSVFLRWQAVTGASSYTIYRGTTPGGEGTTPYKAGISTAFFNNTIVTQGVLYYYQVSAVGTGGEGPRSVEVHAGVGVVAPTATPKPVATGTPHTTSSPLGAIIVITLLLLLSVGALVFWRSLARTGIPAFGRPSAAQSPDDTAAGEPLEPTPRPKKLLDYATPPAPLEEAAWGPLPPMPTDPPTVPYSPELGLERPRFSASQPSSEAPEPFLSDQEKDDDQQEHWDDYTMPAGPGRWEAGRADGAIWSNSGPPPPPADRLGSAPPPWPGSRAPIPPRRGSSYLPAIIAAILIVAAITTAVVVLFVALSGPGQSSTSAANILPTGSPATVLAPTATDLPTMVPTISSTASPTMMPTPSPSPSTPSGSLSINAGGDAAGAFGADTNFNGGLTSSTTNPIDMSRVRNPAPQIVYQSERYGEFQYAFNNLTPNASYHVRLHFAEIYFQNPGQRKFNVAIQGHGVLNDFDIVAEAGGPFRAIVKEFTVHADGSGTIQIRFTNGSANTPKISGIEIIPGD